MAIDPSISLAYRPPVIPPLQIQSPLEQFAKMLSLRNLMQQNQSGELGLQEKQLGLQQLQREMAQQDRISKVLAGIGATGAPAPLQTAPAPLQTAPAAMPTAPPTPPEAAPYTPVAGYTPVTPQAPLSTLMTPQAPAAMPAAQAAAPGRAPSAAAVSIADPYAGLPSDADLLREGGASGLAIVKNLNASREAFYKQQQEKIKLHQAALTGMASLAAGAHDEPSKVEAIAAAFSNGWIDGPARDQLMSHPFNKKEWDDFAVNSLEGSKRLDEIRAQVNQTALEKKQAHDQLMYPSEEAKAVAEATSAGQKAAGTEPITPQQVIANKLAADIAAETVNQHAQSNAFERTRIGISRQEQGLRQRQFDATYGALVDPATGRAMEPEAAKAVALQDPVASAIANYQAAPPSMSRGGQAASIMRKVMAINPDYNAQNWQAQSSVLKNFTSGKVSNELRATNTALSHVGMLNDAIDALNNGDLRTLNAIGNRFGLETGKTPAAVFQTIVGKVGPELAQAYGEATGGERKAEKGNFDPSLPPQTLRANLAVTAKLLGGKIGSTKFQWESTMGKRPLPMISPEAQNVLDKLGSGGAAGAAAKISTKAEYDKLPSGAQYVDSQDGKTYTKR